MNAATHTAEQAISEAIDFLEGFDGCDINGAHVAPILAALRQLPEDFIVVRPGRTSFKDSFFNFDDAGNSSTAFWYRHYHTPTLFVILHKAVDAHRNEWQRRAHAVMDDFGTLVEVPEGGVA